MNHYYIVPGLGNSGPEHWQSWFEKTSNQFIRITQKDWDAPECTDWVETIDRAISSVDLSKVILIGHSLGCMTIAHWAATYKRQIKGALLVAPSDPEALHYIFPAKGFTPVPKDKINFRTIVVASADDQWVSPERAAFFANNWGSELINIGNAGHINVASGHTQWEEGLTILQTLN